MPLLIAYHVSTKKNLDTIETNVCDDQDRDGDLYRAKVACFTTTTYNEGLPDFSPYPRSYADGEYGYRYVTEFNPKHYDRYLMAKTTGKGGKQVHFLLLDTRRPQQRVVSVVVREYLRAKKKRIDDGRAWAKYFPSGQANDYAKNKVFVNVMFWHAVPVKKARDGDGSYQVIKKGPTFRRDPVVGDDRLWFENMLDFVMHENRNSESEEDDDEEVGEITNSMRSTGIR